jgi:hypothetical protein
MFIRHFTITTSKLKSFDKTIIYFFRILQIKSEESKKLSVELDEIVKGEMTKFINDFRASLMNIYKDLRYM